MARLSKRCSNCYWVLRMLSLKTSTTACRDNDIPFICEYYDGRCVTDRACDNWKGAKYTRKVKYKNDYKN